MMKKVIIFALILSINMVNPVHANEECTNLSEEQIQSSVDKATEGKTPSEVSVEAIIDQINNNQKPVPGSYRGRLSTEPENIRKTLLDNNNA